MWFWVRVPVLSVHSTVAVPRVSMALARRTSTRWLAMRQAPIAMNTVRISGNSCGSMDMARVMPASTPPNTSPRTWAYSSATATLKATPTTAKLRTHCRVWRCKAEGVASICLKAWPMRPICVAAPVWRTSASPVPRTTSAPENTQGKSSPPGG